MNKAVHIFCVIFILLVFQNPAYSEESATKLFPEQINWLVIEMYIANKSYSSEDDLRQEYEYILNFFDECVSVSKENISIYLNENSLKRSYPIFTNGLLTFEQEEQVHLFWDDETMQHRKVAAINPIDEIVNTIAILKIYNEFIDYWFFMTGELLRPKYDIYKELPKFLIYL